MTPSGSERTWVPPGHYYSPIPSADDIAGYQERRPKVAPAEIPGITLREEEQLALLERLRRYYADQPWVEGPRAGLRYYFENDQYSYGDAIFLFCMLRELRPNRIVEIGGGFTTAAMLDTAERFLSEDVRITCLEPYPERVESLLRPDHERHLELMTIPAQDAPLELFTELGSGDLLFVDSTHVSKLRSDVNRVVLDVMPRLASGVAVHFHDVFWPFEYPLRWIEENRAWNELYLLRAFLSFNPAFEILLFTHVIGTRHRDLLARVFPLCMKNPGGSLWLRRS